MYCSQCRLSKCYGPNECNLSFFGKGYVRDAATYRPRPRIARACSVDSSVLREANLSLTASILGVFMKIRNTSILFSKRFWVVSASLLVNLLTTFGHYRPCPTGVCVRAGVWAWVWGRAPAGSGAEAGSRREAPAGFGAEPLRKLYTSGGYGPIFCQTRWSCTYMRPRRHEPARTAVLLLKM